MTLCTSSEKFRHSKMGRIIEISVVEEPGVEGFLCSLKDDCVFFLMVQFAGAGQTNQNSAQPRGRLVSAVLFAPKSIGTNFHSCQSYMGIKLSQTRGRIVKIKVFY